MIDRKGGGTGSRPDPTCQQAPSQSISTDRHPTNLMPPLTQSQVQLLSSSIPTGFHPTGQGPEAFPIWNCVYSYSAFVKRNSGIVNKECYFASRLPHLRLNHSLYAQPDLNEKNRNDHQLPYAISSAKP